jgi:eukaryotic-like serine/threonine-protein kinase
MASETALLAPQDHQPGDVIAHRYVLQRKLGEGGMGVVWVAHSTALDVDVALKMLKPELAGTQAVDRMAREARAAAQLGHPALVRVSDFGTSEHGEPFLAMELLSGEELHVRLAREQRLPAQTAVALLLPIIDGLGIAHEKGIVHRDIKPENIFIAIDGQRRVQPKVLDFGIAKLGQEHTVSRLTQVGAVMGSPYYLSPEQAEGLEDIDFRCDIWSIGVVLYEALTGVAPFAANNYNALMRSILRDQPTPITELAAGDAQLWMIIERCLKKDREQRWGSMWELGEALAL